MQFSSSDISGWASGIIDVGGYSGVSVVSVAWWLQNNLGGLNLKIGSEYSIQEDIISPEMPIEDMAVYTQMYDCFFLKRAARQTSAYALTDVAWSKIHGDEQGIIFRSTPSEVAKVFRGLASDCKECLEDMVFHYNQALSAPRQVLTYPAVNSFGEYLPPSFLSRNAILSRWG
jgi:hypothetical protein